MNPAHEINIQKGYKKSLILYEAVKNILNADIQKPSMGNYFTATSSSLSEQDKVQDGKKIYRLFYFLKRCGKFI